MPNKYKLNNNAGTHFEGKKTYKAGDEFITDKPLDKLYPGKWTDLGFVEVVEPKKAKAVALLGDEVTGEYETAVDKNLRVFQKDDFFFVTTAKDPSTALNSEGLKAKKVVAFIASV